MTYVTFLEFKLYSTLGKYYTYEIQYACFQIFSETLYLTTQGNLN